MDTQVALCIVLKIIEWGLAYASCTHYRTLYKFLYKLFPLATFQVTEAALLDIFSFRSLCKTNKQTNKNVFPCVPLALFLDKNFFANTLLSLVIEKSIELLPSVKHDPGSFPPEQLYVLTDIKWQIGYSLF